MSGDFPRAIIRDLTWHSADQRAGALGFSGRWHITQRLSDAPYTGGLQTATGNPGDPPGR